MSSKRKKKREQRAEQESQVKIAEPDDSKRQDADEDSVECELDSAEAMRREIAEWKDKFLRAKAEQNNALRRAANEAEETVRFANMRLLRGLLDVVDDFDRSIEAASAGESVDAVLGGIRLVREKLDRFLADQGVEPIQAEGEAFDPARHEALMQQPATDCEPGTVIQQASRGYTLRDRVLRPAKVIVAAAPQDSEELRTDEQETA